MISSGPDSVQNIILLILAIVVLLIAAGCIFAFVRAIFLFIFSQGKEDKIKKAWNSIRYMIIGLFLTVVLLFVFPIIFKWVGLEHHEEYSAKNIFNKAGDVLNNVFQLKDIIKESQMQNQYRGNLYYMEGSSNTVIDDYTL